MQFTLLPSARRASTLLQTAVLAVTLSATSTLAGFDFKVATDHCPYLNIQLSTGTIDGSTKATSFNLTIGNLPSGSLSGPAPAPFYSAQIPLDNSALFINTANDKGYFFNYSLGSQYAKQEIRSVLLNATLLDLNNVPLKTFGITYTKKTFLDPLCRTTGTGNNYTATSGIPSFANPTGTSTGTSGGENSDDSGPDTKLIVGLVVGLVGGVLAFLVVAVVWWRKRQVKKGKRAETANPYAADHMGSDAREWKPVD
ncbi:hypothetical protein V8E36_000599 [Tilletia maclaganii]